MKALWANGWSTPAWVKARFKLITRGRLQSRASHGTKDWSQDIAQRKRLPMGQNRNTNGWSPNPTELSHIIKCSGGSRLMHTAGTTSEAPAVLKNRLQRGVTGDSYMYIDVLRRCSKQKDFLAAKQVHDCVVENGIDKNPYVANSILNAYIQCRELFDARQVFDEFEKKTVVTWNMMIAGYAKYDHVQSAFEIFNQMLQEGARPDEITYLSILKACANPLALTWGKEVHAHIRRAGLELDLRVGTALVQMYAKCGCILEARRLFEKLSNRDIITWNVMIGAYAASGSLDDAWQLFDRMGKRNRVTWNIMIGAYAEHGHGVEAHRLFLQMRREGFEADTFTYVNILNASASAGALKWVNEIHDHARKAGLESDLRVGNSLVHMYAKCGSIDDARLVFGRMERRDLFTWTKMIGALAQHGCGHEGLELFRKMTADRVRPDGTTFAAVLSACCHGGLLDDGRRLFSAMTQEYGIEPTVVHYTCMVDLLGRAGHLEEAKLFISAMPVEPDGVLGQPCWGLVELTVTWSWGNSPLTRYSSWSPIMPVPMCSSPTSMLQLASGRRCRRCAL